MSLKIKICVLLVALLQVTVSFGQGKSWNIDGRKHFVGIQANINNPIAIDASMISFKIHKGIGAHYRYMASRSIELGVSFDRMSGRYNPIDGFDTTYYKVISQNGEGRYNESITNFSIRYYVKKKGGVAPVGLFYSGGYSIRSSNHTTIEYDMNYYENYTDFGYESVPSVKTKTKGGGVFFGIGREFAIYNRVNFGFEFQLNLISNSIVSAESSKDNKHTQAMSNNYQVFLWNKGVFNSVYRFSYLLF